MTQLQPQRKIFFLTIYTLFGTLTFANSIQDAVKKFMDTDIPVFNHLTIDKNTGNVYIGARNKIYQLSDDLELLDTVITGPITEFEEKSPGVPKQIINNINKILIIDYTSNTLISCGSVLNGICSVRNLHNITDNRYIETSVVTNDAYASAVAFISPGPIKSVNKQVMFVGNTVTNRHEMPAVCSRSLEEIKMLKPVSTATQMFLRPGFSKDYQINYIYGFSSEGFSYFLTQQVKELGSNLYQSKLVRLCQNDEEYNSYIEVPLVCNNNDVNYNLINAAYVGKPGSLLAGMMGITTQDDVLFAVFSQTKEEIKDNAESSALCVYSLKSIRKKFTQNIKTCFDGNGNQGLEYFSQNQLCIRTEISNFDEEFCGLNVNSPLGGEQPVVAAPVFLISSKATAVAATSVEDFTVVFIGTSQGHLKKIVVEDISSSYEYENVIIDEGSPINKDLYFDSQLISIYVMTERKISKVLLQDCSIHTTCLKCLSSKDPYCGWCSLQNKCSTTKNCQSYSPKFYWKSFEIGNCNIDTQLISTKLDSHKRTLKLEPVPTSMEQFWCIFTTTEKSLIVPSVIKYSGSNCVTPKIKSTKQYKRQIPEPIFNCKIYYSCSNCSRNEKCKWIESTQICRNEESTSTNSNTTCNENIQKYILVPNKSRPLIGLQLKSGTSQQDRTQLRCQYNIEKASYNDEAIKRLNYLYCNSRTLYYISNDPIVVSQIIVKSENQILDNYVERHNLVVYKCNEMAKDCKSCLDLPDEYNCGWCQSTQKCEVQQHCDSCNIWLSKEQSCSGNIPFTLVLRKDFDTKINVTGVIFGNLGSFS